MSELLDALGSQVIALLEAQGAEFGAALESDGLELAAFSSTLMQELADGAGDPGFDGHVITQARRLAVKTAFTTTENADELVMRAEGILRGVLGAGAIALGSLGTPTA